MKPAPAAHTAIHDEAYNDGQPAPKAGGRAKKAAFATVEAVVEKLRPGYPVFCLHKNRLTANARYFLDQFPGRVLYAVKCNPGLEVLQTLFQAGIHHYDTASLNEIALIRENFPRADCYFMHPVKSRAALMSADTVYNIDHYIIDHEDELHKLVSVIGGGDGRVCFVRVATPKADTAFNLSDKFGATPQEAARLLQLVDREGFQTGIAFHVGSQCRDPKAYSAAMQIVGEVVEMAGVSPAYVDVGGGFPALYEGEKLPPLKTYFDEITKGREYLSLRNDCTLMCEPGRAMVADAVSLIVQVHLRKDDKLYINDGIFHSLSETVAANIDLPVKLIRDTSQAPIVTGQKSSWRQARRQEVNDQKQGDFTIFGPTCDSCDRLPKTVKLPQDVQEGDWLQIGMVGAYSNAMASHFNGFHTEAMISVEDDPLTPALANTP